jgi:uncharacterized protein
MGENEKRSAACLRRTLSALFLALAALVASAPDSFAQDPFGDFLGGLFGGDAPRPRASRPAEQPRVRRMMPHQENRPPTYWRGGEAARAAPKRAARRSEPSADENKAAGDKPEIAANYFVAVMGDTLGVLLANGLEETFADRPEIGIVGKSKENSGLVRDDYFDWPKAAKEIAGGAQKFDVAVMMIGSNDRQSLRQGAQIEEPLSPRWREIYAARVDAVLAPFREKKIPVVWVGLPVMKSESFSADMARINEIVRERVNKDGDVFVDLWETLADERGQFSAFGPDINGQIVKLRTADGVHFTEAGALSVAHFVANELKKLYEDRRRPGSEQPPNVATAPGAPLQEPAQAATPTTAPPSAAPLVFRSPVKPLSSDAPTLPERPAVGPLQPLSGPPAPAGAELARRNPAAPAQDNTGAQALAHHIFIDGGAQTPRANRADDWSWKPPAQ